MTWRELNLCRGKPPLYRALMGGMLRRVSGLGLTIAAVLLAPAVADAAPTGTVGGWRSPLAGAMTLTVWANPDGVRLVSATATLGGVTFPAAPFENRGCEGLCPAEATINVATIDGKRNRIVPDGLQELVVTVLDEAGQTHRLRLPQDPLMIEVDNTEPNYTSTVSVNIGSGTLSPNPSPPGGPVGGDQGPSCRSPRLSMRLADRPLRFRRGVPVLKRGRVYRYAGKLTCRINGARRPAPRGMPVQVRNRLRGGWTVVKPSVRVRKAGVVVARLAYRSRRTIIFRVRGAGGELVRVRIPIRVARR
jgi:hypothetical protein